MDKTKSEHIKSAIEFVEKDFVTNVDSMGAIVHENARMHGWWDDGDRNFGLQIALMHSELSEALEAWRKQIKKSDHIPTMDATVEEMADTVIRIMDTCHRYNLPLAEAIVEKTKFNIDREYRHGGKLA